MRRISVSLFGSALLTTAAATAQKIEVLREFTLDAGPRSLAYSPDGRWLVSGSRRGDLQVIAGTTGKLVRTIPIPGAADGTLRFSPDGDRLAMVVQRWVPNESRSRVVLLEVATGKPLGVWPAWKQALDWSADGQWLAFAADDSQVCIVRVADGKVARRIQVRPKLSLNERLGNASLGYDPWPAAVAFTSDTSRLAVGFGYEVRVYDPVTAKRVAVVKSEGSVSRLRYSANGGLHRASYDGRHFAAGHKGQLDGWLRGFDVQRDGARAAVATTKGTVMLRKDRDPWRIETIGPIALHPGGKRWAQATTRGIVQHGPNGRALRSVVPVTARPVSAVITANGRHVAVTYPSGEVRVFDGERSDAKPVGSLGGQLLQHAASSELLAISGYSSLRFVPPGNLDGRGREIRLIGEIRGGAVRAARNASALWLGRRWWRSVDAGRMLKLDRSVLRDHDVRLGAPSPDGAQLAVVIARGDGTPHHVLALLGATGKVVAKCDLAGVPRDLDWSPNGKALVVATDRSVVVYDARLEVKQAIPARWNHVRFVDDEALVATTAKPELERWRIGKAERAAALPLPSAATALECGGGRAVVTCADRVLLVRVSR